VAKGTFFLHFPAKDALLLEYGAQVTAELAESFHEYRGSAASALNKILRILAERATHHADIVRLVVREVMAHPITLADATEQSRDLSSLLADVVRLGQQNGEFRQDIPPRLAAGILTSTYLAIVTEWVRHGGNFAIASVIKQSIDVVLYGLAKKPGKEGSPSH
jgi:AcrR family transcriptional regulator